MLYFTLCPDPTFASQLLAGIPVQFRSRHSPFARFPHSHTVMERHGGPILGKWAGETLLTGCTPAFQTAESADCPFTASFGTLLFGQTGLLKFLFPNPGEWQVTVETEDERIIGKTTFLGIITNTWFYPYRFTILTTMVSIPCWWNRWSFSAPFCKGG